MPRMVRANSFSFTEPFEMSTRVRPQLMVISFVPGSPTSSLSSPSGTPSTPLCSTTTESSTDASAQSYYAARTLPSRTDLANLGFVLKYAFIAEWCWLVPAIVLLILYATMQAVHAVVAARLLDELVATDSYVGWPFIAWLALVIGTPTAAAGRIGLLEFVASRVSCRLRIQVFNAILRHEMAHYDVTPKGTVLATVTSECDEVVRTIIRETATLMRNVLSLLIGLVVPIYTNAPLTSCLVAVGPIMLVVIMVYDMRAAGLKYETRVRNLRAAGTAQEAVVNVRTVKSFGMERQLNKEYAGHLIMDELWKQYALALATFTFLNDAAPKTVLTAIFYFGSMMVRSETLSKGALLTFVLYQRQVGEEFAAMISTYANLRRIASNLSKTIKYLHSTSQSTPTPPAGGWLAPATLAGNIKFVGVDFSYPSTPGTRILRDVNFECKAGETTAIVGASGAGKSSLFALLQRFYSPKQGNILLDGHPIQNYDPDHYRDHIAVVAQEPDLFSGSFKSNILGGYEMGVEETVAELRERVVQAAKTANIHEFIVGTPNGYDSDVGEGGGALSGGQKQRIAIARALFRQPKVLLLDEATSALDAESQRLIRESLRVCTVGRTVLMIAHRLAAVESADHIVVMKHGRVVEQGKHEELMREKNGVYRHLVLAGRTEPAGQ